MSARCIYVDLKEYLSVIEVMVDIEQRCELLKQNSLM